MVPCHSACPVGIWVWPQSISLWSDLITRLTDLSASLSSTGVQWSLAVLRFSGWGSIGGLRAVKLALKAPWIHAHSPSFLSIRHWFVHDLTAQNEYIVTKFQSSISQIGSINTINIKDLQFKVSYSHNTEIKWSDMLGSVNGPTCSNISHDERLLGFEACLFPACTFFLAFNFQHIMSLFCYTAATTFLDSQQPTERSPSNSTALWCTICKFCIIKANPHQGQCQCYVHETKVRSKSCFTKELNIFC